MAVLISGIYLLEGSKLEKCLHAINFLQLFKRQKCPCWEIHPSGAVAKPKCIWERELELRAKELELRESEKQLREAAKQLREQEMAEADKRMASEVRFTPGGVRGLERQQALDDAKKHAKNRWNYQTRFPRHASRKRWIAKLLWLRGKLVKIVWNSAWIAKQAAVTTFNWESSHSCKLSMSELNDYFVVR